MCFNHKPVTQRECQYNACQCGSKLHSSVAQCHTYLRGTQNGSMQGTLINSTFRAHDVDYVVAKKSTTNGWVNNRALCHEEVKAHVKCSNRFPSFGGFEWVSRPYRAKKDCLQAENAQFWEGTSRLGATAPGRHR